MSKEKYTTPETDKEREERYAEARRIRDEHEKIERERLEKYKKMVEIADEMGPRTFFERGDHIGFTEWGDALAFQDLCVGRKFSVKIIHPPKGANSFNLNDYFRIYPE